MDDIRISKPYTPQQCRGGTPQSLPRVQKIVRRIASLLVYSALTSLSLKPLGSVRQKDKRSEAEASPVSEHLSSHVYCTKPRDRLTEE